MKSQNDAYLKSFQEGYITDEQLWGDTSSFLLNIPLDNLHNTSGKPIAIDVGCGQGRNIPYLISSGFKVIAVDILEEAIQSVCKLSQNNFTILPILADGVEFMSSVKTASVHLVLANQVIQNFKTLQKLDTFIFHSKRAISIGGLIALAYFIEPRDVHPQLVRKHALILPPKFIPNSYFMGDSYLTVYYNGYITDDKHGEQPHKHAIEQIVIKRIS